MASYQRAKLPWFNVKPTFEVTFTMMNRRWKKVDNANWIKVTIPTMTLHWYYFVNVINQKSLNRRWNNVEISSLLVSRPWPMEVIHLHLLLTFQILSDVMLKTQQLMIAFFLAGRRNIANNSWQMLKFVFLKKGKKEKFFCRVL